MKYTTADDVSVITSVCPNIKNGQHGRCVRFFNYDSFLTFSQKAQKGQETDKIGENGHNCVGNVETTPLYMGEMQTIRGGLCPPPPHLEKKRTPYLLIYISYKERDLRKRVSVS
ncbi:hypothetical protein DRQ25_08100 [Candidatus Fermentibacteria bacterium]|nr:MAG: hypothetical protein DRQ25_08100 [Candidatus Fermentibacteria bacterium]